MIYETDTNRVLIWDNSAWVMIADTNQPPGLQLVKEKSFTNETAVNFDGCFSNEFDNYTLKVNITNVSANTNCFVRMRTGTTTVSTSVYQWAGAISYMGSAILTAINSGGTLTGFVPSIQDTLYNPNMPFQVEIMQPFLAHRTAFFSHGFQPVNPQPYYRWVGGTTTNTTVYESLALNTDGVATMSGSARVYGYRN
jgi:hypothetical protein